jgi:hypothetical protein
MNSDENIRFVKEREGTVISHASEGCKTARDLLTCYWHALSKPHDRTGQENLGAAVQAWKAKHE